MSFAEARGKPLFPIHFLPLQSESWTKERRKGVSEVCEEKETPRLN